MKSRVRRSHNLLMSLLVDFGLISASFIKHCCDLIHNNIFCMFAYINLLVNCCHIFFRLDFDR